MLVFIVFFGFFNCILVLMSPVFAENNDIISATKDGRINANIENKPLNGVLREISGRFKMELKGSAVGSESVTLSVSNVTLEEILKKLMRGYNYVLIKPDKSDKTVLMILSKAERTKYTEPSIAGTVVAAPSVPPSTVKMPVSRPPAVVSAQPPMAIGVVKAEPKTYTEGAVGTSTDPVAGGTVKIVTSTGATKEISRDLLPPMPPSLSGVDTPPSIPVVTAGTQVDTPPSIPQISSASPTDSATPGGQQQQTGQQSTTSVDMKDMKPPQIPF